VSHDRYFLNRVCNSLLVFEGEGVVQQYVGNYDDYLLRRITKTDGGKTHLAIEESATLLTRPSRKRKLSYKETRQLETIEADILAAEAALALRQKELAESLAEIKSAEDWAERQAQLAAAEKQVAELYERWEELEAIAADTQAGN
jgi:ATP-binding cassette subfamily F protein uup